jgi:hypothetical protein
MRSASGNIQTTHTHGDRVKRSTVFLLGLAVVSASAFNSSHRMRSLSPLRWWRVKQGDYGKESDSEQQAEKHNLCSLVTERAKGG